MVRLHEAVELGLFMQAIPTKKKEFEQCVPILWLHAGVLRNLGTRVFQMIAVQVVGQIIGAGSQKSFTVLHSVRFLLSSGRVVCELCFLKFDAGAWQKNSFSIQHRQL